MADVFESILGQAQVRAYLRSTAERGTDTHAYLFTGPVGSGKTAAAFALAAALICDNAGCGKCSSCLDVMRKVHPDVVYLQPEGAQGYLVDQIRTLVAGVYLAPIQAKRKVYILDRVDLLGTTAANAFLKTLEEPPAGVTFILLARTAQAVLPTVLSRCQVVPFRHIPPTEAAGIVVQNTGTDSVKARIAIEACGGSVTKAIGFVRSRERFEFRDRVLEILRSLDKADQLDILEYVRELLELSKAPLDNVITGQKEQLDESADFLSKSAIRQIEERNKRALAAATLEYLKQMMAIIRSWLRDILMVASDSPHLIINTDEQSYFLSVGRQAKIPAIMEALREVDKTEEAFGYNVSPETCIDALLYTIRKVVHDQGSSHTHGSGS